MPTPSTSQSVCGTVTRTTPPRGTQPALKELAAQAKNHYAAILAGEQCGDRYWHLGRVLLQMRPEFPKGTWQAQLAELEIDKSRASRACRIAKKFASAEEVAGRTIREALGPPPRRKPLKPRRPKSAAAAEDQLLDFLNYVNSNAATLVHEARRVDALQASALLFLFSFAMGHLQQIGRLLMQQARGLGLGQPHQRQAAHRGSPAVHRMAAAPTLHALPPQTSPASDVPNPARANNNSEVAPHPSASLIGTPAAPRRQNQIDAPQMLAL